MSTIGGNKKRTRNSPSNKRYKAAGRSQINKLKRIAKEKKKMERAIRKRVQRDEKRIKEEEKDG